MLYIRSYVKDKAETVKVGLCEVKCEACGMETQDETAVHHTFLQLGTKNNKNLLHKASAALALAGDINQILVTPQRQHIKRSAQSN